jgi:hypothetical protein
MDDIINSCGNAYEDLGLPEPSGKPLGFVGPQT